MGRRERKEAYDVAMSGLFQLVAQDHEDLEAALANLEMMLKVDLRERVRQEQPDNRHWDDNVYKAVAEILRTTKNIRVNAKRIDEYCRMAGFVYAA